jgi:hypothetical protein
MSVKLPTNARYYVLPCQLNISTLIYNKCPTAVKVFQRVKYQLNKHFRSFKLKLCSSVAKTMSELLPERLTPLK